MQPQPQPDIKGEGGGPSQPAVGPSPIATILQTSPSSIATTVPLALYFELSLLRDAPFWRQHAVRACTCACTCTCVGAPLAAARGALLVSPSGGSTRTVRPLTAPHSPPQPRSVPPSPQVLYELGAYLLVVSLLVFLLMYSEYQLVQLTSSLSLSVAGILKALLCTLILAPTLAPGPNPHPSFSVCPHPDPNPYPDPNPQP